MKIRNQQMGNRKWRIENKRPIVEVDNGMKTEDGK